jgi:hypothetical protein
MLGILLLDAIAGINSFEKIPGDAMWSLAIILTVLWPLGIIPAYWIKEHWLSGWWAARPNVTFVLLLFLWCNICSVAMISFLLNESVE